MFLSFRCLIGVLVWMLASGPEERGSILGRVIPKTQEMVFGAYFLNKLMGVIQGKEYPYSFISG